MANGLQLRLPGARRTQAVAEDLLPGVTNDLRGNASRARVAVPHYGRIRYRGIYAGVDLVYHAAAATDIEFDFELAPGVSPAVPVLEFRGASSVVAEADGALTVRGPDGYVRLHAPRVLQDGRRIFDRYRMLGGNRAGFRIGRYNRRRPLLIDPILGYSATFGSMDTLSGVATDASGNVYVVGTTTLDIPLVNPIAAKPTAPNCSDEAPSHYAPCENVFVAKFDPTGTTLIYSTFLGDIRDFAAGIAVGPDGSAFVAGNARAVGVLQPVDGQAWVRKLNPAGSAVVYYTLLNGDTSADAIAVDAGGEAWFSGSSLDLNFPAVNALQSSPPFQSLLASGDGGATWRALGSLHVLAVASFALDPAHAGTAYAATSSGLFKSTDAGASWTQILADAMSATQVAVDPASTLYVLYTDSNGASQIAKSTDGGADWQTLTSAVPVRYAGFPHVFGAFTFDPENPAVLWLGDFAQVGPSIDRSTDGGVTWTDVHDFPAFFIGDSLGGSPAELLVDPQDSSRVYACCIDRLATPSASGFFRTEDGGTTWVEAGAGVTELQAGPGGLLYGLDNNLNPFPITLASSSDHGQTWTPVSMPSGISPSSLAVTASGVLLVLDATGGQFARSADGGSTWTESAGPWDSQATILAADATGQSVYVSSPSETVEHAFVAKLNASGGVEWATLLTGSGQDEASAIAVDGAGNAYAAGWTNSRDFPVLDAFQSAFGAKSISGSSDAFLAKISSDGSALLYSTLFGGSGEDAAYALAVDGAGDAWTGGSTYASQLPMVHAIQAAPGTPYGSSWIAKFDASGRNLLFSTYLGGTAGLTLDDSANAIAVDAQGAVWVGGETSAVGFPLVNAIQPSVAGASGYVSELAPSGAGYSLAFSTYLGGMTDTVAALALTPGGSLWLVGPSATYFSPVLNGAPLLRIDPGPLVPPQPGAPAIGWLSDAASFFVTSEVSPGELATIMGAGLASATSAAQNFPLPPNLGGVSVMVGGVAAPLLYVSPTQINFQVPYNLPQNAASIVVQNGAIQSAPLPVTVEASTPGIFLLNADAAQPLIVHTSDYSLVTPQDPAAPGEYLAVYCSGLGAIGSSLPAGTAASGINPVTGNFEVVLDSTVVPVVPYAGLTPDFAGLYQVNFRVPANAQSGERVLQVSNSNQVLLFIQ